jgi:signal transduction histidine kinase
MRGERASGVTVRADADRLGQVFINLVSNAIKYNTSPDPWVRVESRVREGVYEVTVEDNGPGIPEADRAAVFDKFRRGWAHSRPGASGAGLGLVISRQIMRRFGGSLTLDAAEGGGACFRAGLPVA